MPHKTIEEARRHLEDAVALIGDRFKEGVQKANWQGPASSDQAEANFKASMDKVLAAKKRQAQILATPNTVWQQGAITKGAAIIGERVRGALGKYGTKFGPVLAAMNAASDAARPRTKDWKTNITTRLYPVIEAAKKAAGKS